MNLGKLPKIELHCHLDGSVRPETVIELAEGVGIDLPSKDLSTVKALLTAPESCTSLDDYLKCFDIPIAIMQTRKNLERVAYELMEDAAKDNIKYIEMRYAPLLHMAKGLTAEEVIESVLSGIEKAEKDYDIKGNLILSILRFMPVETAYDVIEAGKHYLGKGVVAVDVAANENDSFAPRYVQPMKLAREYGYRITIHAGETGIGENVLDAVTLLGAERIGHGVFIKDCPEAYEVVKEEGVTLEICPTSNVQTKAVEKVADHPIYDFYKDDIKVTLNTDNRTVSDITLNHEYKVVDQAFDMKKADYIKLYEYGVEASFADEETKKVLMSKINQL